jgi:ribosome-binding factor A
MSRHAERVKAQLMAYAAEFLLRETGKQSLLTVTSIEMSDDLRNATIFLTVLPESYETAALDFAKRQRGEFREFVMEKMAIKHIPFFDFAIDQGEKKRQQLDRAFTLDKLEREGTA